MNVKTMINALPFFWKLYIVCMLFAALRMGEPDWEWALARCSPWPGFLVSAQQAAFTDTEAIAGFSITQPS